MTHALLQNYSRFRFDRDGRVLTVTIPGNAVNAVDAAMHDELARLFIELRADPDSDLIVLTGQGSALCVGGDFDWLDEQSARPASFRAIAHDAKRIVGTLLDLEKPIIARLKARRTASPTTSASCAASPSASWPRRPRARNAANGTAPTASRATSTPSWPWGSAG